MSLRFVVTFAVSVAAATPLLAQELPPPGAVEPGFHAFRGPLPEPGFGFQNREVEQKEREAELKERQKEKEREAREREGEMYDRGMEATYEGRYERAVASFTKLVEMRSARADAALYWKAYAHNKLGQRADALAAVAELTKSYPSSRYLKDAKALEVEVRNASGQGVRPENQADEDLKIIALQSLQHTAPEQAVPMLENVLKGTASPRVKERALYVLALSNNAKAREALIGIAKGSSTPELQNRAIQYLGVHGGRESRAALAEVYASSTDVDIKRRILRAFMVAGERDRLLTAAQTEKDESLRATAVEQLGVMGAHDALWTLYQKEASVDVKRQIIRAMFVGGNSTRLIELAKTEQNPDLRLAAVRNLGIMGSKTAGEALVELYSTDKDPAVRKAALEALFIQGNATGLVALARKEQDPQMKRAIVERLSHMSDKVARDYMLELLK
jgi:HEAT repeat protein